MLPRPELFKWMWFNVFLQTKLLLAKIYSQDKPWSWLCAVSEHFYGTSHCISLIAQESISKRWDWKLDGHILNLWTVCLNCVVNVYQNQENCHQEGHSSRYYLRVNQKTKNKSNWWLWLFMLMAVWPYPRDNHKEPWREIIRHDVEWHLPCQEKLEPGGAVIHPWKRFNTFKH